MTSTTETSRRLDPAEVSALLKSLGDAIVAELRSMPEEVASFHPAPGEWCAKECVGHMLEAERRGFNGPIRTMLRSDNTDLPGWYQQVVQLERRDCQKPVAQVAHEFNTLRADSVQLVSQLTPGDLTRS